MHDTATDPTAYDRFRDGSRSRASLALLASVVLHFALFQFLPPLQAGPDLAGGDADMVAMDLPPEVKVPPPPEEVARPAVPVVASADVSEDVTIAPTTFEANPVEALPPPPRTSAASPDETPVFIPRDVEPRLSNRDRFLQLLMKSYPRPLREAGLGGSVILWLFVDDRGAVTRSLVKESSGYEALDEAAETVAQFMEFEPAINRDRPIGVWVAQRIMFQVQGGGPGVSGD